MDKIDCKILGLLQQDATRSTTDIAAAVGLSSTPCWRRIQRLEEKGVIRKRVALLSRRRLNLGVDVFVAVKSNYHTYEWLEAFSKTVSEFPEVVEFYRMAGESDYLLRVV
ncbi:MAG: Lrp/AsnC family transcriptional regulator, partial [Gammaproteobacteria bacterium]|nr:Lrp/AsnC family transcriptional regulator [Gammaproteobacteria bacterium]